MVAGRPKKTEKEKKDKRVVGYVTAAEEKEIDSFVKEKGDVKAYFVSRVILDHVRKNKGK